MSKAMIQLEADRVEWEIPSETAGGGLFQVVRLYNGDECQVVLQVNFSAGSEAAQAWAEEKQERRAVLESRALRAAAAA